MRKLPKMVFTDCGRAYLAGYVASAPSSFLVSGNGFLTFFRQACGVESEGYVYTMIKTPTEDRNGAGGQERQ